MKNIVRILIDNEIEYKGLVIVQGEGIIKLSELEKYNASSDEKLKNARNAVAGAIRNLNPAVTAERNISFFAYNIGYTEEKFSTQKEIREFYGEDKIKDAYLYAKDLKDRYSVLWMYYDLFN